MKKEYTPIDCDFHDELELLCMHHETKTVEVKTDGERKQIRGRFETLRSEQGKEYLVLQVEDRPVAIRLDEIAHISAP